jgi:DNA-directed RNA polymerase specialized sigma24 family protein
MSNESSDRHISEIETVWSILDKAIDANAVAAASAQRMILERYRPAVFRYLLACVQDRDAAEDLCQEFSLRFVRGDFRNANPEKGRFRDLLKTSLCHLVIDYHKRKRRGMPQIGPDWPEAAAADPSSTLESDRQFLVAWRSQLLNRIWEALAREEQTTGRPVHTVLFYRAGHQEMRSAQMAEQLSVQLGREVTADWVRKWLHVGRERFAELLLAEVAASLSDPTPDHVAEELIDLELFQYCKLALDRWRQRLSETPPG